MWIFEHFNHFIVFLPYAIKRGVQNTNGELMADEIKANYFFCDFQILRNFALMV